MRRRTWKSTKNECSTQSALVYQVPFTLNQWPVLLNYRGSYQWMSASITGQNQVETSWALKSQAYFITWAKFQAPREQDKKESDSSAQSPSLKITPKPSKENKDRPNSEVHLCYGKQIVTFHCNFQCIEGKLECCSSLIEKQVLMWAYLHGEGSRCLVVNDPLSTICSIFLRCLSQ